MTTRVAGAVWAVHAVLTMTVLLAAPGGVVGSLNVLLLALAVGALIEGTYAVIVFGLVSQRRATLDAGLHIVAMVLFCVTLFVVGVPLSIPFFFWWSLGLLVPLAWQGAVFIWSGFYWISPLSILDLFPTEPAPLCSPSG